MSNDLDATKNDPARERAWETLLTEARRERDAAQEACRAWQGVYETLEAHILDRVAMKDEASPETYLSILRSSVARVEHDSRQLLQARWTRESEAAHERDEAKALSKELMLAANNEAADRRACERERDALREALREQIEAAEKSSATEDAAAKDGSMYAMGATFAFSLTARRLRNALAALEVDSDS